MSACSLQYASRRAFEFAQQPNCHENIVKVGAYVLGEYGHLIADEPVSIGLKNDEFHTLTNRIDRVEVQSSNSSCCIHARVCAPPLPRVCFSQLASNGSTCFLRSGNNSLPCLSDTRTSWTPNYNSAHANTWRSRDCRTRICCRLLSMRCRRILSEKAP